MSLHVGAVLGCLSILISTILASRYPIIDFPERVDDEGNKWVGPIRLAPLGSTDEEINNFTAKTIEILKPNIAKGFPEYSFPVVDPFSLSKFDYDQAVGPVKIKLAVKNINIEGFSKFKELKLHWDTPNQKLNYIFEVPKLNINAVYKAGGTAVLFPITGSGLAHLKIDRIRAAGYMNVTVLTREDDGVEVVQIHKTIIEQLKFEGLNARVQGLFSGRPVLSAAFHFFANNYGPQLFDALLKNELSARIAETVTEDIVNPFIYNIPQFTAYLKH